MFGNFVGLKCDFYYVCFNFLTALLALVGEEIQDINFVNEFKIHYNKELHNQVSSFSTHFIFAHSFILLVLGLPGPIRLAGRRIGVNLLGAGPKEARNNCNMPTSPGNDIGTLVKSAGHTLVSGQISMV